MEFPSAINLAAGTAATGGQITIGSVPATAADVHTDYVTLTGANTSASSGTILAGPVTVEPGQLNSQTSGTGTEGALQILQSYLGTSGTGSPPANLGRLACPSATQSVGPCTTVGPGENWVGVYSDVLNQNGFPSTNSSVSVTPVRYGRVGVSSKASGLTFNDGDFVCKDDANGGYVIDNGSTPCPIGESIGVGVGDPSSPLSNNRHLVDLVPEASVSGAVSQGLVLQFTCSGTVTTGTTLYLNGELCNATTNTTEFALPYQSGTYTFKNLYVNYKNTPAATDALTLYVGGSATSITCNPSPSGAAPCPDVTHTATITPSTARNYSVRLTVATGSTIANLCVTIQLQ